ncbi:glyoxalase/bleomycin resistance/extradiol dioxygenase family protein [Hymenobacter busanensis]|uniref:Glyoxalase/bleomycin resistance/extradiol dioxygenase family protein n=1 Tax=Hymenobacter busanensis TaxID=2607656 RepID=A0A7L4ZYF5_9BACT|nr:VOC family protein [Hymenobacter busanensis]KAA9333256.1 glyoxalase/bleomycin resistance/extradiol dioxygenase family protein [Hymenobacter busanensis]QHJ08067.1 glyoxalase/bleomycin resistance/extradiol dioxygenase family protein [Hymenobacter busanensis]
MATSVFVNLPVRDLNASMAFFTQVGFRFNPHFTNEQGACMVVSDTIYVMLLAEPFFQSFTSKKIVDARSSAEVILCLSAESREAVDAMVDKALAAGGQQPEVLQPDPEFMYGRNFQDLDGHLWEVMYMDPAAIPQDQPAAAVGA